MPRDRKGEYDPQIIDKYQKNADGMVEKVLALYAAGMSTTDISYEFQTNLRQEFA